MSFYKKLIFQENRDPCNNACVTLPTCLKSPRPSCIPLISHCPMPTSPNTFSSYPIALNFPSATSASAAPRPCHRPGFQPPPSTRPTSFPTHTDKGIWKHSSHWFVLPWCFTALWIIQLMLQQLGLVWFGCSCDSLHEACWMYVHLITQTMNMHIPFQYTKKKNYTMCI